MAKRHYRMQFTGSSLVTAQNGGTQIVGDTTPHDFRLFEAKDLDDLKQQACSFVRDQFKRGATVYITPCRNSSDKRGVRRASPAFQSWWTRNMLHITAEGVSVCPSW